MVTARSTKLTVWRESQLRYFLAVELVEAFNSLLVPQRSLCQKGVTAALFTTPKRRKQPERPSVDAWISGVWCIDTGEYDCPLKGREFWHLV